MDDYNAITTSLGYRINKGVNTNTTHYQELLNNSVPENLRVERQHNDRYGIDANLNFIHKFLKKNNTLTLDGNFNYTVDDTDSNIYEEANLGKNLNYNSRTRFMAKADYVLPITENSQFEAGVRTDFSNTKTDFSLTEKEGNNDWEVSPGYTNKTQYEENIFSAYLQYGNKFGDFSFLAGLRQETAYIKVLSEKDNTKNAKNYTDLFPTLHLNYNITEKNQLQLSYSRRINRPQGRMLNPYKNFSDDRNTFQGNPNLDPAYTNSYELGYSMQKKNWSLTPSVYYQRTDDPFQRVTVREVDESLNTFPVNGGHENRYGGEISFSFNPYKWWRFFGEVNLYRYENYGVTIDSGTNQIVKEDVNKDGFSWTSRLNMNITLPAKVKLQFQGFYMSPKKSGQNETKEMAGMNMGISKDLLKDKATVLFNIQDVFNSRKRKTETFGSDFYRYSEMQWRPRQFTLTFTYRFNDYNKKGDKKKQNQNTESSNTEDMDMM